MESTITNVLPSDLRYYRVMCLRASMQSMYVYIDQELRMSYNNHATRLFGDDSNSAFVFVPIEPKDIGKTIKIVTYSNNPHYSGIFNEVVLGTSLGIVAYLVDSFSVPVFVALILFGISLVFFVFSILLRILYKKSIGLEYLGAFSMMVSFWVICESRLRQIYFPNNFTAATMAFLLLWLIPIPIVVFIDRMQNKRYHKGYTILMVMQLLAIVTATLLQVAGLFDFVETVYGAHFCIILTALYMLYTLGYDIAKGNGNKVKEIATGVIILFISTSYEIVSMYVDRKTVLGTFVSIGILFFVVVLGYASLRIFVEQMQEMAKAKQENRAKSNFLATVSHEIRTPINAIMGMNEMILREEDPSKVKEYAENIERASKVLLSLVNNVLDFSKIESGRMEISEVAYSFENILLDVVNTFRDGMAAKGLTLRLEIDKKIPKVMLGDELRIRQIVMNLMNNAMKYTKQGSVTIRCNRFSLSEQDCLLCVEVEDTGIGIREEDIEKLFISFSRVDERNNRNIEGSGLGLAITQELVKLMGGNITVASVVDKGSNFKVVISQRIVDATPIGEIDERLRVRDGQYKKTKKIQYTAPDARILIVDDNEINLLVAEGLLRNIKAMIHTCRSGEECLDRIQIETYDLIFMDHMMPHMDGIETLRRMQEMDHHRCKKAPVIIFSANAMSGAREHYRKYGFDDYVTKPIAGDALEEVVRTYLDDALIHIIDEDSESMTG